MMTKAAVLCAGITLVSSVAARAGELPAKSKPRMSAPILLPGQRRQTILRVFTDASGRVARVEILRSAGPVLDATTRRYVLEHWHGPPNRFKDVTFDYQLRP